MYWAFQFRWCQATCVQSSPWAQSDQFSGIADNNIPWTFSPDLWSPSWMSPCWRFPCLYVSWHVDVEDTCLPWEFCKLQINICPMSLLNWSCFSFIHIGAGRKSNKILNSCKFKNATKHVSYLSHMVQFCCQLWTWFSHFFFLFLSFLSETLQSNMCGNVESTRLEKRSF